MCVCVPAPARWEDELLTLMGSRQAQDPDWTCHSSETWPQQNSDSKPPAALLMCVWALPFTLWWPHTCLQQSLVPPWLQAPWTSILAQPLLCLYWSFHSHTHSPACGLHHLYHPPRREWFLCLLAPCVPSWIFLMFTSALLPWNSGILPVNLAHVTLNISRGRLAFLCFLHGNLTVLYF